MLLRQLNKCRGAQDYSTLFNSVMTLMSMLLGEFDLNDLRYTPALEGEKGGLTSGGSRHLTGQKCLKRPGHSRAWVLHVVWGCFFRRAGPVSGPLLFVVFILLVGFVLLNMFVAILSGE